MQTFDRVFEPPVSPGTVAILQFWDCVPPCVYGFVQVVIVPIVKKEADSAEVMQAVDTLQAAAQQAGLRCKVDATTEKTPGWKFNHYEMKVCTVLHQIYPSQHVCGVKRIRHDNS